MSASFLPAIFVPLTAIAAFVSMALFFLYVEADA